MVGPCLAEHRECGQAPQALSYLLAHIVDGKRVVGYDNGEGKGDHRHYRGKEEPYHFVDVDRLFDDFYADIRRYTA